MNSPTGTPPAGWFRTQAQWADPALGARTVVVVGVERGGTSLAAAMLHGLGVHMGEGLGSTFEDPEILSLFLAAKGGLPVPEVFADVAARRDAAHAAWGWKVPSALPEGLLGLLRNPCIVMMSRDSVATAMRMAAAHHLPPLDCLRYVEERRAEVTRFILKTNVPALLVSYEKALAEPAALCQALCAFLGLKPDADQRAAAIAVVRPSPPDYVAETSQPPVRGSLDHVGATVDGWVADMRALDQPLSGHLVFDDGRRLAVLADTYRRDLEREGLGDGRHAFSVPLPEDLCDGQDHVVTFELAPEHGARAAIGNSPRSFCLVPGCLVPGCIVPDRIIPGG